MANSRKVKILLLEDIDGVGQAGEIRDVSEGYARNFLFPEGKAALATQTVENEAKQAEEEKRHKAEQHLVELQARANELEGTEIRIPAQVKEGDELYAKITTRQVSDALHEDRGIKIQPKRILMEPIRELGTYTSTISFGDEIEAQIKITVFNEQEKA